MDVDELLKQTQGQARLEQWQFEGAPSLSRLWVNPRDESKGWLIFLPGLGDFGLRYLDWFLLFAEQGWGVLAPDWPGHGLSQGKRGDIPSLQLCEEMVDASYDAIEARHGRGKFALAGHSMGARVAIAQLARNQRKWDWAWLASPLLKPSLHNQGWKSWALPWLARLAPKMILNTGVSAADCRQELQQGDDVPSDDALWHHLVSARFAHSLLQGEAKLEQQAQRLRKDLPLLVTQGLADPICPPEILREWLAGVGERGLQPKLVELEAALHEPLLDTALREELELLLQDWLGSLARNSEMPPSRDSSQVAL